MSKVSRKPVDPMALVVWSESAPAMSRREAEKTLVHSDQSMLVRTSPKNGLTLSMQVPHQAGVFVHAHVSGDGRVRLSNRAGYRFRAALEDHTCPDLQSIYKAVKAASIRGSAFRKDPIVPDLRWHQRIAWAPRDTLGSSFTDPHQHNPRAFQYLVKGVTGWGDFERFVQNPESVRKQLNSASVLRHDFRRWIFGCTGGLILKAPAESIYVASHQDMYVSNSTIAGSTRELSNHMGELYARFSLPSPRKICKRGVTSFSQYTEVAVLGTTADGKPIAIDGIYVQRGVVDDTTTALRAYAKSQSLPVVELERDVFDSTR